MRQSNPMVMTALVFTILLLALAAGAAPPRAAGDGDVVAPVVPPELPAGSAGAAFFQPRPPAPVEERRQAAAAYSGATLALAAMIVGLSALFALQAVAVRRLGAAQRMGRRTAWPQPEARLVERRPLAEVLQFRPRRRVAPATDADRSEEGNRAEQARDGLLPPARTPVVPFAPAASGVGEGDGIEEALDRMPPSPRRVVWPFAPSAFAEDGVEARYEIDDLLDRVLPTVCRPVVRFLPTAVAGGVGEVDQAEQVLDRLPYAVG